METVSTNSQVAPGSMTAVTWEQCRVAAADLWSRIANDDPTYLYGVPRGGCTAATMVQAAACLGHRHVTLVDEPIRGAIIIDDLVDSGRTLAQFAERGFQVDALFRKPTSPITLAPDAITVEGWQTFPWEANEGTGAEDLVIRLLQFIGEDPTRDGLRDTPKRVLKAWKEMTVGYGQDPKAILSRSFDQSHDELILLRGVRFTSCCEHHLLPFTGTAAIGYIPSPTGGVVGISKLARVLECFARRLQLQERLTKQVADAITEALSPLGVGVVIRASHSCMSCRGCLQPDSDLITSVMTGMLRDSTPARAEFLSLVNL